MLVVHIKSTNDTEDFEKVYSDLNATILINPSKSILKHAIIEEKETIIFIGHGTEYGLLNQRLDGYIIDSSLVQILRDKTIIGIWCYAGNFADKYGLKGFFTSNFISNIEEFIDNDFNHFESCENIIQKENILFSERVNNLIKTKTPLNEWVEYLQTNCSDYDFVKYNHEALYYGE
jgi:hypothetical protein